MQATPPWRSLGTPLSSAHVLEVGDSLRVQLVGSLLRDIGATVERDRLAPRSRLAFSARVPNAGVEAVHARLAAGKPLVDPPAAHDPFDVIISDEPAIDRARAIAQAQPGAILVTLTVFGLETTTAGPGSDLVAQASSGILATNGFPSGDPIPGGVPAGDHLGALLAATGVVCALRQRRETGSGSLIDIATRDVYLFMANGFLSQVFAGEVPKRLGNRHVTLTPWNTYPTADGSVVICTSGDEQWRRLRNVLGHTGHDEFATLSSRIARSSEVDELVGAWTATRTTQAVLDALEPAGIPVARIRAWRDLDAPADVPSTTGGSTPSRLMQASRATLAAPPARAPEPGLPLKGFTVVELGAFTAAPFCGRILAGLGADVVKIEPPGGESVRTWHPQMAGAGSFFQLNNLDKLSLEFDLKSDGGKATLHQLVAQSDLVVSNFSPGVLDKLGFDDGTLRWLNPDLITCAVSGFGQQAGPRPALDTIIQAEAGVMSLNCEAAPVKFSISLADLVGACSAAFASAIALVAAESGDLFEHRIDLSMLTTLSWVTEVPAVLAQHAPAPPRQGDQSRHPLRPANGVFRTRDEPIVIGVETVSQLEGLATVTGFALEDLCQDDEALARWASRQTSAVVDDLTAAGVPAHHVVALGEAVDLPLTAEREIIVNAPEGPPGARVVHLPLHRAFGARSVPHFVRPLDNWQLPAGEKGGRTLGESAASPGKERGLL